MRSRWLLRELERRERAWEAERARLIETICRLAGQPTVPTPLDEEADRRAARAAELAERERAERDDLVDYDQLPEA